MEKTTTLTKIEMEVAAKVGCARNIESICNNRTPRFPEEYPGKLFVNHIYGALSELAFCKIMGLYWDASINKFHASDIYGHNIEVRWSHTDILKVRPDDNDITVVKMTGLAPHFKYLGWIDSKNAKEKKWLKDIMNIGVPAYFVPRDALETTPLILKP